MHSQILFEEIKSFRVKALAQDFGSYDSNNPTGILKNFIFTNSISKDCKNVEVSWVVAVIVMLVIIIFILITSASLLCYRKYKHRYTILLNKNEYKDSAGQDVAGIISLFFHNVVLDKSEFDIIPKVQGKREEIKS